MSDQGTSERRSRINYYLDGRLFEWTMSASMLLVSAQIMYWPETLRASAFQWITRVMSADFIGVTLLLTGIVRSLALIANGSSLQIGPRARAICAIAGAVMWVQFGIALVKLSIVQQFPSPGIPFWFMFTLAELRIAYRAVLDVRIS